MRLNNFHILLALFVILGAVYAFNISNINKISSLLAGSPAKVSFTVVIADEDKCPNCFDASLIIDSIGQSKDIKIGKKKTVSPKSRNFNDLIKKNEIKNLPAIIISGDISDKRLADMWKSLNGKEINGKIVVQNLLPFYDLTEQKAKGIVNVTLIKDGTCEKCFDENQYLEMIKRFGMFVGNSSTYDVSSTKGKEIVEKYQIIKVPTMILSSDAADYPWFSRSWQPVGTKEKDGRFILREVQKIDKTGYKNLKI